MLFHITHTHTWDACPYHDPDRARDTFGKAIAGFAESDAELIGAWADPAAHEVFFVVDADSAVAIERALAPIIDVGWAKTVPVGDLKEIVARRSEG